MLFNYETARDLLAAWDRGEAFWSIEMGGLGPSYEQCIQVLAVEIMRDYLDKPLPEVNKDGDLPGFSDATLARIGGQLGGPSGAQVGAACAIAYRFLKHGPAKALETIPPGRKIIVSNLWPKVTTSPTKG